MPTGVHLVSVNEEDEEGKREAPKFEYQSAIGSIMYASVASRPDLAVAMSILSRFNNAPRERHYKAVEVVLRYLRGTCDCKMVMGAAGSNIELHGFCDSDWASDVETRRSTTGYVFFIGSSPVSWCTQRQGTVALSATEAEYMSVSAAAREAVWLRSFLFDVGYPCQAPTKIRCDNKGAVSLTANPIRHRANKHIDIRHHYVRELVDRKKVTIIWTSSQNMVADIMTKPIPKVKFEQWRSVLFGHGIPCREG